MSILARATEAFERLVDVAERYLEQQTKTQQDLREMLDLIREQDRVLGPGAEDSTGQ
jgi:hypothetical protein